jgi:hypothetical protein
MVLVSGVSMLVGEALTVMVVAARLVRRRRRRMVEGCIVALADVVLRLVGCGLLCMSTHWGVRAWYICGTRSVAFAAVCEAEEGVKAGMLQKPV